MTTLTQLNCTMHRRCDFNMHVYRKLLKKGKGWIAKNFLTRAERNREAAEDIQEVMKETAR
ncbi:hypothetical protein JYP46_01350 [Nitratireductor aquimarinus]|uniref:hypothetical protein n=1 Tax=Alphaproteobacteria TaxID=28211 RepID=UPI0019D3620C|nr:MULTISPECIES: hypothetical protein [Alphaproteobacteria]MBN7755456.1 hypothetical protein [Nitratireductor aquimarinus]MBY5998211.1 hypothetical protein [Tritonibacter mobilis]MBY6020238.1 hypothetical protein [Nitratireductor sp. DP7N14-4]